MLAVSPGVISWLKAKYGKDNGEQNDENNEISLDEEPPVRNNKDDKKSSPSPSTK